METIEKPVNRQTCTHNVKVKPHLFMGGLLLILTFPVSLLVPVADIKAIVTGKDCPHMKEKSALKQNKVTAPFLSLVPLG